MPSTKYERLSYPTLFLNSMDSGIRNNFLEYRTYNKSSFLRDEMFFYTLFAANKAKLILNRHI